MARVDIKSVRKTYDGANFAVNDVSVKVPDGELVVFVGPSGCGKSTLLRMVAGLIGRTSGEITIGGADVTGPYGDYGFVFQAPGLMPWRNVIDNVLFPMDVLRRNDRQAQARARHLLQLVGLQDFEQARPHQLSGGMQQRVSLCRALIHEPTLLLMDEPFSGLDDRLRDDIRDETLAVLKEEGAGVLLVTHEPEEAMRMADEIALMRDGKIVQRGAPYHIYNAPVDKAAAGFFSDINVIRGKVQGALTDTPFGQFLAPGQPDGTQVDIVIRPQHLKIDFDRAGRGPNPTPSDGTPARGLVQRARFMGSESLVEFKMDFDGSILRALIPSVFLPKAGTPLWIMIRRDRCFVFPR